MVKAMYITLKKGTIWVEIMAESHPLCPPSSKLSKDLIELQPMSDVTPDTSRAKEFLEGYNIESLRMVGTIEKNGQLWALIDDGKGNVHYVKEGNYLGRNYGRIASVMPTFIQVVERFNRAAAHERCDARYQSRQRVP